MTLVKARISVAADGSLTGRALGLPPGEHDANITITEDAASTTHRDPEDLFARVRAIQAEIAKLPVLDQRTPDAIIGYDERGQLR